jgi:hypothetical protein
LPHGPVGRQRPSNEKLPKLGLWQLDNLEQNIPVEGLKQGLLPLLQPHKPPILSKKGLAEAFFTLYFDDSPRFSTSRKQPSKLINTPDGSSPQASFPRKQAYLLYKTCHFEYETQSFRS